MEQFIINKETRNMHKNMQNTSQFIILDIHFQQLNIHTMCKCITDNRQKSLEEKIP